jgi:hypothetical protein
VKRVSWAAYNDPGAKEAAQEPPKPRPAQSTAPDPNQPPRTVEEMAKRASKKTAEQIEKTGENVKDQVDTLGQKMSDSTKKTWTCIASLFTRCTE